MCAHVPPALHAPLPIFTGAGFIGSALVHKLIGQTDAHVVTVDKLIYAGNLDSLAAFADDPHHRFERVDICDAAALSALFVSYQPRTVMHLAAESHVDHSIDGPAEFIQTNVVGTFSLLDQARRYWDALARARRDQFRFLHVSTDEVFGSLGETGYIHEETPYAPNSAIRSARRGPITSCATGLATTSATRSTRARSSAS